MPPNMSIDELVAVNSLLIQRETNLAELNKIESTISDILGDPYPFDLPKAPLPSTRKGKRTNAPKKPKARPTPKIRRLHQSETGYRVTLVENGTVKTHDLLDIGPLQSLLTKPLPRHRIIKIATLDEALSPADTLFDSN